MADLDAADDRRVVGVVDQLDADALAAARRGREAQRQSVVVAAGEGHHVHRARHRGAVDEDVELALAGGNAVGLDEVQDELVAAVVDGQLEADLVANTRGGVAEAAVHRGRRGVGDDV